MRVPANPNAGDFSVRADQTAQLTARSSARETLEMQDVGGSRAQVELIVIAVEKETAAGNQCMVRARSGDGRARGLQPIPVGVLRGELNSTICQGPSSAATSDVEAEVAIRRAGHRASEGLEPIAEVVKTSTDHWYALAKRPRF